MELELVCDGPDDGSAAVVVTADERARIGDLRHALQSHLRTPGGQLYAGLLPLSDTMPLAEARLVHGAAIGLGRPVWPMTADDAPLNQAAGECELAVVGGLHCGPAISIMPRLRLSLGRHGDADLVLADDEVSRDHAHVSVTDTGLVTVTDAGSRNGIRRRGYRLTEEDTLDVGDVFGAGETVIGLRERVVADADVSTDADGGLRFNRPPRLPPPRHTAELLVPVPPTPPKGFRFPWLTVTLPLLVGGLLFLIFPNMGYFLVIMLLSPVMIVANLVSDRRSGRKEYKAHKKVHDARVAELTESLAAAALTEERDERSMHPDPTGIVTLACVPSARLWERRRGDPDFLVTRLGLVDRPATVSLRPDPSGPPGGFGGGQVDLPTAPTVYDVPVTVPLAEVGVLGIASTPRHALLAAARAVIGQAAALHAPGDLGIVVISGPDTAADWEWASWLPHTRPVNGDATVERTIAGDPVHAEARLAELRALVNARHAQVRGVPRPVTDPATLLVLDGARALRGLPGLGELLMNGPGVGIYALCLDMDEKALPDECRATLVTTNPSGSRSTLRRAGQSPVTNVLVDGLLPGAAARLARALTPLRTLGTAGGDAALPDSVRFTELASLPLSGVPEADAAFVTSRWAASPAGRSTTALLGVGPDGPLTVDLRDDGPHALVAGTTGAGKSELLQTFVASLALANMPDALTFVLVDYKGGSAFSACAELPHVVGLVTDLDGHLVTRALDSLSAELRRRETLLERAGAKNIEDYWARTGARLPRLVIVVDEFASLVEEVPDFVPGVIGIGMRGRSLGVHVVLATQRPGGVVTPDLRANVNLRICLRVTADAESQDVVDIPGAAHLSPRRPGRAFVKSGPSTPTCFQAARIGWPRRAEPASTPVKLVSVRPRRLTELTTPAANGQDPHVDVDTEGSTDLSLLVAAVEVAAARLGIDRPDRPWLPPLPDLVTVADLPSARTGSPVCAPLGLVDRPDAQSQDTFLVDLETTGPVAVAGGVRTGRSTVLRTFAAGLAAGAGPDAVHIYGIDCGNRALAPLAALPHVGAVVDGDDPGRLTRLLDWFDTEVDRRQRLLAAGHGSLADQRAVSGRERLPYLVVLLDRLEAFVGRYTDLDAGRLVDMLESLLRRGPAVGLLTVLTTDRTGFTHRVSTAVEHRLVLRQADRDDMSAFGLNPRQLPGRMPAGRGVWVDTAQEVQVALLDGDRGGSAQAAAVGRLAAELRDRWRDLDHSVLPHRVDPLPDRITSDELVGLRVHQRPGTPTTCTPGVGGDHLGPVDVDLAELGSTFLVAGPSRSGRSTALVSITESLAGREDGTLELVLVAPRSSPLRDLHGLSGVLGVVTAGDSTAALTNLEDILDRACAPTALVVDDGELVASGPLADRLEEYARGCRDGGSLLVAAATTEDLMLNRYRGWLAATRRSRSGLLLTPASHVDGEVFELRLPRSTGGGWPAGRALLVERGLVTPLQVPEFLGSHRDQ